MSPHARFRWLLALALAVVLAPVLAGCSLATLRGEPPATAAAVYAPEGERPLDAATRLATFASVWETVRDRYYDPALRGVDWDRLREPYQARVAAASDDTAFWRTLQRLAAELSDAHTRVDDPLQARARRREEAIGIGASLSWVQERVAIGAVDPGSPAASAGLRPGDVVVAVDGVPIEVSWQRWRAEMGESSTEQSSRGRWLRGITGGLPGTALALGVERDGWRLELQVPRAVTSTALKLRGYRLGSGIGLVAFNRFRPPLARELRGEIATLGRLEALVLDLRGNGGGNVNEVRAVLEVFLPAGTRYTRSWTRASGAAEAGRSLDWTRSNPDGPAFVGPLAVLLDTRSASGAEIFAAALQEQLGARVVGTTSCGCALGIRRYQPLPGGGELAVSEIGFETPRGRRLEGTGVMPDQVVTTTIDDLRAGVDPVLEAALRLFGAPPGRVTATSPLTADTAPESSTAR